MNFSQPQQQLMAEKRPQNPRRREGIYILQNNSHNYVHYSTQCFLFLGYCSHWVSVNIWTGRGTQSIPENWQKCVKRKSIQPFSICWLNWASTFHTFRNNGTLRVLLVMLKIIRGSQELKLFSIGNCVSKGNVNFTRITCWCLTWHHDRLNSAF